jgi:outer membrane receptor protein involved in Fe transport
LREALNGETARKFYPGTARPDREVSDTLGDGRTRPFTENNATSAQLRVARAFAGGWRADVTGDVYRAEDLPSPGDIYAPFPARKNARRGGVSATVSGAFGGWTPLFRLYSAVERSASFNRADSVRFVSFDIRTHTDGVQLQAERRLANSRVLFGADATRQRATSLRYSTATTRIAPFSPDADVTSLAALGEVASEWQRGRVRTTVGGRIDRVGLALRETAFRPDVQSGESTFPVFTPTAAVRAYATRAVSVHASAGQAFVAPDAFSRAGIARQVASGGVNLTIGNPALDAERSTTVDAGVSLRTTDGALEFDITGFRTRVRDRSVAVRATFASGTRPALADGTLVNRVDTRVNAGDARMEGAELSLRYDLLRALGRTPSLALTVNATPLITATERTPVATIDGTRFAGVTAFDPASVIVAASVASAPYGRVRNVAPLTAFADVTFDDRRRWSASLSARYVGQRVDQDFTDFADISDIEYAAYATVDALASVRVWRTTRLGVTVSNLTDENFYEKRGFNLAGRATTVRVSTMF